MLRWVNAKRSASSLGGNGLQVGFGKQRYQLQLVEESKMGVLTKESLGAAEIVGKNYFDKLDGDSVCTSARLDTSLVVVST